MFRKCSGFTLLELLAVIVIIAVMVVMFYPVFARSRQQYWPTGVVLDGTGRPMPGAVLRFRDSAGRVVTTVTADASGTFRLRGLGPLCRNAIDGFALSWATHSTGGADQFRFTPLITQQAVFHDTSGRPMSGLAINFQPDIYSRGIWVGNATYDLITDRRGVAQIRNAPTEARFVIECRDRRYVVKDVKAFPAPRAVRYDVTVTAPATIAGRLLTPDGKPLRGRYAYVTQVSRAGRGESPEAVAIVGPTGRFRFRPLRPGRYYVSPRPLWRPRDTLSAQCVTVAGGQTVSVEVRAMGLSPHPVR